MTITADTESMNLCNPVSLALPRPGMLHLQYRSQNSMLCSKSVRHLAFGPHLQVAFGCKPTGVKLSPWKGHATDHGTRMFATMYTGAQVSARAGLFRRDPSMGTFYFPSECLEPLHTDVELRNSTSSSCA